eukprot:scaffold1513_cov177-Isochrysis_galbana.AAC.2
MAIVLSTATASSTAASMPESGAITPGIASSPPRSAGQAPSSAGQAPSSAGQAPSSAGQAPSSAGQAPSSAGNTVSSANKIPSSVGRTLPSAGETSRACATPEWSSLASPRARPPGLERCEAGLGVASPAPPARAPLALPGRLCPSRLLAIAAERRSTFPPPSPGLASSSPAP